jgi:hypothetical protein
MKWRGDSLRVAPLFVWLAAGAEEDCQKSTVAAKKTHKDLL